MTRRTFLKFLGFSPAVVPAALAHATDPQGQVISTEFFDNYRLAVERVNPIFSGSLGRYNGITIINR